MRRTVAARLNVGRFTESARGGLESEWPHFCRPKLQSIRIVRPRGSIRDEQSGRRRARRFVTCEPAHSPQRLW